MKLTLVIVVVIGFHLCAVSAGGTGASSDDASLKRPLLENDGDSSAGKIIADAEYMKLLELAAVHAKKMHGSEVMSQFDCLKYASSEFSSMCTAEFRRIFKSKVNNKDKVDDAARYYAFSALTSVSKVFIGNLLSQEEWKKIDSNRRKIFASGDLKNSLKCLEFWFSEDSDEKYKREIQAKSNINPKMSYKAAKVWAMLDTLGPF